MILPENELRTALFERLDGNLDYPVYSTPPDNVGYPFIQIGSITMADSSTKCGPGQEIYIDFDGFDVDQSTKKLSSLLDSALQLITTEISSSPNMISLTNFNVAGQYFESFLMVPQPDPKIKRMTLRMKFRLTEL